MKCELCPFKYRSQSDIKRHQINFHFAHWQEKNKSLITYRPSYNKTAGTKWSEERKQRCLELKMANT